MTDGSVEKERRTDAEYSIEASLQEADNSEATDKREGHTCYKIAIQRSGAAGERAVAADERSRAGKAEGKVGTTEGCSKHQQCILVELGYIYTKSDVIHWLHPS